MVGIKDIMLIGLPWNLFEVCMYFIIYSAIGWFVEVCYMTVELGEHQNRGFLNGPICPIYGFGVLLVIIALTPFIDRLFTLFFCSMLLCTALELVVGIGLNKIFHNVWWDYSNEKFNFHGYICLKNSLIWGIGCVLMMRVAQPLISKLVNIIPETAGMIFIMVSGTLIIFDFVISLCTVNKLNLRLKQIDEIAKKLRYSADTIGVNLSEEVLELKGKYDKLIDSKNVLQERIIKAFPTMRSEKYSFSLEEIKKKFSRKKDD